MQPARATATLLAACRHRAVATAGRPLRWLRRRPSLWVVAVLLVLHAGPAAGGHVQPEPAGAAGLERVASADLPDRSSMWRPQREGRPSRPTLAASAIDRQRPPWPVLGRDTADHLLVRALGEIRRRDPAGYREMRRRTPGWGLTLCDRSLCDRNVQGQTLLTSDNECLSSIDVTAALGAARRNGIPGLPWLADVLVHEHAHCHNLRDEYSSLAAQRAFIKTWPAGPGRERATLYVRRLYTLLDATGNWASR
jgi:hypothetical protein